MIGVDEGSDDLAQSEAKRHQTSRKLAALPGVRTYQSPWRNKLKGISPPWPITPSTWTSASCSKPQERSRSALVPYLAPCRHPDRETAVRCHHPRGAGLSQVDRLAWGPCG
jgi:hypothetical protein